MDAFENALRIRRDGCQRCEYWRYLSGGNACHYLLENDKRRPRNEDGSCAGFKWRKRKREQ